MPNIIFIKNQDFEKLRQDLLGLSGVTSKSVGDVVARTAFYGREKMVALEEKHFSFGHQNYVRKNGVNVLHTTKFSKQGWKAKNGRRLINYSFETAHALRSKASFSRSVKKAYVSSLMMNLFEQTATWRKNSPFFGSDNFRFHRLPKGYVRKGYNLYDSETKCVESAIPVAIKRTEEKIKEAVK